MKQYKFKYSENHLDGYNQGHEVWKSPYEEKVGVKEEKPVKKVVKEKVEKVKIKKYKREK